MATLANTVKCLEKNDMSTTGYATQGNMVMVEDQRVDTSNMETGGTMEMENGLVGGEVVTIQLDNSFLHYAKATSAVVMAHFTFSALDPSTISTTPKAMFLVEKGTNDCMTLQCAFKGAYLSVQEVDTVYEDGYMVTTSKQLDDTCLLHVRMEGDHYRLIGHPSHHLSCVQLGDYNMLASRSILPERSGLFTITQVQY
jgi:hypothetical protein